MKKVITHFIKYPVAVNVLILAVVVMGIMGMLSLKSSFFPLNESRNISISVAYPGASPTGRGRAVGAERDTDAAS